MAPTDPEKRRPGSQSSARKPGGGSRTAPGKKTESKASARARLAELQLQQQQKRRRRAWLIGAIAAVVVAAIVVAVINLLPLRSSADPIPAGTLTGPAGPEGMPLEQGTLLAPAPSNASGDPVDGIQCQATEQVAYHIHTHLAVYVDGKLRPMPAGIGLVQPVASQTGMYGASSCIYWLHVHAQDGVIHVEAPSQTTYTLGQFFAIWGQPLSSTKVGPASGPVTVYVNGKPFSGDPATIPLESRESVQLNVGSPAVGPQSIDWSNSQL